MKKETVITVMIVDDNKDIRAALKKTLEIEGYRVIPVDSGKECLQKLKSEKVDLILLDVLMPGITGIQTLEEIRKSYPSIKVMMITVVGKEETKDKTVKLGVEGYLVKPVSKQSLIEAVASILKSEI